MIAASARGRSNHETANMILARAAGALAAASPRRLRSGRRPSATPPAATTLERIRTTGTLKLGYRTDARPFSYQPSRANPTGTRSSCEQDGRRGQGELGTPALAVDWVPVTSNRCMAPWSSSTSTCCARRQRNPRAPEAVAFSIPIFAGGFGVIVALRRAELRCGRSARRKARTTRMARLAGLNCCESRPSRDAGTRPSSG